MAAEKKIGSNGVVHPSEKLALAAENAVFDLHDRTETLCESLDRRMDEIQKKIETKFHHRRKGDKNEEPTSD